MGRRLHWGAKLDYFRSLRTAATREYRAVSDFVVGHARQGAVVVYSGYRNGNFVFGMRMHQERGDMRLRRTDKLLPRFAVTLNWNVTEMGVDEAGIQGMLKRDGGSLIVAQRGFRDDIPQMQRVNQVLAGPEFRRVASFPVTGDQVRMAAAASPVAK